MVMGKDWQRSVVSMNGVSSRYGKHCQRLWYWSDRHWPHYALYNSYADIHLPLLGVISQPRWIFLNCKLFPLYSTHFFSIDRGQVVLEVYKSRVQPKAPSLTKADWSVWSQNWCCNEVCSSGTLKYKFATFSVHISLLRKHCFLAGENVQRCHI